MAPDSEHDPTSKKIGEEPPPEKQPETAKTASPTASSDPSAAAAAPTASAAGSGATTDRAETPATLPTTPATRPLREPRATSRAREAERLKEEQTTERRRAQTELLVARTKNRRLTDLGLLIVRLLPFLLLLRGIRKVQNFGGFRDQVAQTSIGQMAPDVIAVLLLAAEVALPIALIIGLLTRLSGLLLAASLGTVFVVMHAMKGALITPQGALNGEAAAVFALTGLALFLTGAGRFSIDHLIWRRRTEARAERRAEKLTT